MSRNASPSLSVAPQGPASRLKPPRMAPKRMGRVIAIGDVHGCADELEELIDRLAPQKGDHIVMLGDLVNRGPDSRRVIALARKYAHRSLLGNHELRLLNYRRSGDASHLKRSDHATLAQLGSSEWRYLEQMSLTFAVPELDTVLVHGGFLPHLPWGEQSAEIVTRIQVVGPDGQPEKAANCPGAPHWSEVWKGPPFVIYGHTPLAKPLRHTWSLGIDTDCARGGRLTACVLPGCEIVQVESRRRLAKAV